MTPKEIVSIVAKLIAEKQLLVDLASQMQPMPSSSVISEYVYYFTQANSWCTCVTFCRLCIYVM